MDVKSETILDPMEKDIAPQTPKNFEYKVFNNIDKAVKGAE